MRKISVLGCGWLGLPLATDLIKTGFSVNGSTTTEEKMPILKSFGINPFSISVNADGVRGDITSFLNSCDTLIVDFPPKLRGDASENFVSKVRNLIPFIESSTVAHVIFISSISVYGENQGIVTASTLPEPVTESGMQLLEAEQLLMENTHFTTTIVRFGGLVGNDRHPVYHLAGRTDLDNPGAPINLIHITDCLGIILSIVNKNVSGEIFNTVAPFHPSRKDYYSAKAASMGLAEPHFKEEATGTGKVIDSNKLRQVLDYEFSVTEKI
ncbi:Rossmann-fold NAD(P)-binding domain-containing protein [Flavobacterium pallidum]|uniref:NAD(P)-dependent oxidoreductase n=1 Tax=Flavobacterium pallidum TaxID=2172098 RepID=A0A2S1SFP5_9FLAO|nr:NAD(P)H-binding protein [Flavobacterium pallidum]AWI25205.1 NAD(P)-dependent oxidoreductase [Flavobacterium pallidum]